MTLESKEKRRELELQTSKKMQREEIKRRSKKAKKVGN
jgi:hypothetical protein